jgi:nitrile hydratase accessory protein
VSQADLMTALSAAPPPCGADGPVFAEPWQAQAFALVVALHERGLFTWAEWAAALSAEIKAHDAAAGGARKAVGVVDDGSDYYHCWLHALEDLIAAKGHASHTEVDGVAAAWARAAEATPHGRAIELANDPLR